MEELQPAPFQFVLLEELLLGVVQRLELLPRVLLGMVRDDQGVQLEGLALLENLKASAAARRGAHARVEMHVHLDGRHGRGLDGSAYIFSAVH